MSESLRSTLHVVRTVRRAGFVGREVGRGAGPEMAGSMGTSMLALGTSAMELGPEVAAVFGVLIAVGVLSQFAHPELGGVVLPTFSEVFRPWDYHDRIREMTLQKIYGASEGAKVWNAEWNQRAIDIDLRVRSP